MGGISAVFVDDQYSRKGNHAELLHHNSVLIRHDGIGKLMLLAELFEFGKWIRHSFLHVETDHLNTTRLELLPDLFLDMRSLLIADSSPVGKHDQYDRFAAIVRKLDGLPQIVLERKIRDLTADFVRWRSLSRTLSRWQRQQQEDKQTCNGHR